MFFSIQILSNINITEIIYLIFYSIVITSLTIGTFILFSLSVVDFNILSIIKYMFTKGIKRAAKVTGKTILYGSGIATGVDAGFNLYGRYLDYSKNNPAEAGPSNSNNGGSNNNNNNNNSNTTPNKNTPTNTNPSNTTPSKATPSSKPSSTPARSSLILWALSYININVSENSTDMFNFLSSIFTLELIVLSGFINLLFYFISNIIILKYDIESKISSPFILRIIKFYVKSSIYFIIFEIILTLLSILSILFLVCLVISSLV